MTYTISTAMAVPILLGLVLLASPVFALSDKPDFVAMSVSPVLIESGVAEFLVSHANRSASNYQGPWTVRYALFNASNQAVQYFTEFYSVDVRSGASFETRVRFDGIMNGGYQLRVTEDPAGVVDESDETNNAMAHAFSMTNVVPLPKPDLKIAQVQFTQTEGRMIVRVANAGTAGYAGGPIRHVVEFYDFSGAFVQRNVFAVAAGALAPGAFEDFRVSHRLPAGTYFMRVMADDSDVVEETSQSNNSFAFLFATSGWSRPVLEAIGEVP